MTTSAQLIKQADQSQSLLVCDILGDAFSDDPVMQWMNSHSEIYSLMFKAEILPLYQPKGMLFINEAQTGASAWLPPGVSADTPFSWTTLVMLWKMFRTGGRESLKRGQALETLMAEYHYKEPHYYLFAIGAASGQQGRGIGSALLRAGLEVVDQNPHPCYLESTNFRNNALYQRFGFEVIDEVHLPDNGPTMWPMLRPA